MSIASLTLAHGDGAVGDAVPEMAGKTFGGCSVQ
jgi:hypothetical protein